MMKTSLTGKGLGFLVLLLIGINGSHAAYWQVDNTVGRLASGSDVGVLRFIANEQGLRDFLHQVPAETSGQSLEIELPMPDGSLARYSIVESSIMESGLSAKFPDIKSYVVRGIDQPGSSGRVDISPKGFRGLVDTSYGRLFIDPESFNSNRYMSRTSGSPNTREGFQCGVYDIPKNNQSLLRELEQSNTISNRISGSITAYRLAVSATPEYVTGVGGGLSNAMSEINTVINRVNQIYERDLGIKLFLVDDNDDLIDVAGEAGFSNDDGSLLLTENQTWIDSKIGTQSYDIGHIFSTGGGGVAAIYSVCSINKAMGVTGLPGSLLMSDTFYIDYVSHEIGHQFGANHTFNGSTGACAGSNRYGPTAVEPGSGSTIMAYAGICGGENLQSNSDATFHAKSIEEVNAFVSDPATGGSCATILATSPANNDPLVSPVTNKIIPTGTPFRLVGSGTDADGDTLSYQWDQMNAGGTATTDTNFDSDQGDNPLFRSYTPQGSAERHFPSLSNQLGVTSDIVEAMQSTLRTLNFRLTVRDCKSGQDTVDMQLMVDTTNVSPFAVTSHSVTSSFVGTGSQTITWNVANTATSAVNCPNVDIDLLSFSADHTTYGVTSLIAGVTNNGFHDVTIGDRWADNARYRVSCSDNVFYAISNADLDVTGAIALPTTGNSSEMSETAACGPSNAVGVPLRITALTGGGGTINLFWLLALLTLRLFKGLVGENSKLYSTPYTQF